MNDLMPTISGLAIPPYDHETHVYTGGNPTTSTYRIGGASGKVVAVVSRTFDGSNNVLTQGLVLS